MTTMTLQTVPACTHRVFDLDFVCADRQTRGFEDLRCDGRRARGESCVAYSASIGAAPSVVILKSARKWTAGALQRAVEAALGGRKAFRAACDAASDRYRLSHSDSDLRAARASERGEWVAMRAGSLSLRARFSNHRTAVLSNEYTAVEVAIPGVIGSDPHWYNMANRANGN